MKKGGFPSPSSKTDTRDREILGECVGSVCDGLITSKFTGTWYLYER